MTEDFFSETWG